MRSAWPYGIVAVGIALLFIEATFLISWNALFWSCAVVLILFVAWPTLPGRIIAAIWRDSE